MKNILLMKNHEVRPNKFSAAILLTTLGTKHSFCCTYVSLTSLRNVESPLKIYSICSITYVVWAPGSKLAWEHWFGAKL